MLPQTKRVKDALKSVGLPDQKVFHSDVHRVSFTNPNTGRKHTCTEHRGNAYVIARVTLEQYGALIDSPLVSIQTLNENLIIIRS